MSDMQIPINTAIVNIIGAMEQAVFAYEANLINGLDLGETGLTFSDMLYKDFVGTDFDNKNLEEILKDKVKAEAESRF